MRGYSPLSRQSLTCDRCARASYPCRRIFVSAKAGGFGKTAERSSSSVEKTKGKKGGKQRKRRLQPKDPLQASQPSPNSREEKFLQRMEEKADGTEEDREAFEQRLAKLRSRGEAKREAQEQAPPSSEGGILASGPLSSSRQSSGPRPQKKEAPDTGPLGLPQVLVGAVSLGLVAVLLFTSGFGPGGGPSPQAQQGEGLSQEQRQDLQARSQALEEQLKERPSDAAALRELSDLSAVLGDYKKSSSLMEQVVKEEPEASAAWQALAEAKGRLSDYKGAAMAFEKSIDTAGKPSLRQLQGLAAALVSSKRPAEAIQKLQSFEPQAGSSGAVGQVELQLLLGKVYSQWDKHFSSAIAVYDGIIQKFPDDFRGYLARGALLKENGRKGDAQRMFIQARFLAPQEAQSVVDAVAER